MKALILYAHPWDGSYNHALLDAVVGGLKEAGIEHDVLDLNREGFDPILGQKDLAVYRKGEFADPKVGEYQARIKACTHLFIIFPVWWGAMPAVLKGFFDKVLLKGWAYNTGALGRLIPLITNVKQAVVITTMNAPRFYYDIFMGQQIKHELIDGMLKTCGISRVKWFSFGRVAYVKRARREAWLARVRAYASRLR